MKRSISAEWLKLRHSRISLVIAVLPIISLLIGCANYYLNQGALQNGWYSLWIQVSLFYGVFSCLFSLPSVVPTYADWSI